MRRLTRRLRTAIGLGRADRRLLAEAAAALLAARRQAALPFRQMATELGGLVAPGTPPTQIPALAPAAVRTVSQVGWAVRTAAPWMPFRSLCLQQAIAARAMLAQRGIGSVLHLGVGDGKAGGGTRGKLVAHAWLDAGGLPVTGYPVDPLYAEAGRFV